MDEFTRVLSENTPVEILVTAGLSHRFDDGHIVDYFRSRVVWPIQNIQGRVIAIAGRVLDDRQPKYLNSPDSPVFHKGRMLFNIHRAEKAAVPMKHVILFEDYFSVFVAHTIGVNNVVSGMGTPHSEFLARMCHRVSRGRVTVCYDPDAAGDIAAVRMSTTMMIAGIETRVCRLLNDVDPDEFILEYGYAPFIQALNDAKAPTEFIANHLQNSYDMTTLEGQAGAASALGVILEGFDQAIARLITGNAISEGAGIEVDLPAVKDKALSYKAPARIEMTNMEVEMFAVSIQNPSLSVKILELEPSGLSETGLLIYNILVHGINFESISEDLQSIIAYLNSVEIKGDPETTITEVVSWLNIQSTTNNLNTLIKRVGNKEVTLTREFLEIFTNQVREEKENGSST